MNATGDRATPESGPDSASPAAGGGEGLQKVTRVAMHLTRASGAALALEVEPGRVVCVASCGNAPARGTTLERESGISGLCLRTGEFQVIRDAETDIRVDAATCRELGVRSLLLVPVRREERVAGVLSVYSPELQKFSADDSAMLERLRLLAELVSDSGTPSAGKADTESPSKGSDEPAPVSLPKAEVSAQAPTGSATVSPAGDASERNQTADSAAPPAVAEFPFRFGAAEPERRRRVPAAVRILLALGLILLVAWGERGQWTRLHGNRSEPGARRTAQSAAPPAPAASVPVVPPAAEAGAAASGLPPANPERPEQAAPVLSDNPAPHSFSAATPADLATVGAVRYSLQDGTARAILDVDREVYYRASRLENPPRAFFDLRGARLANRKQEMVTAGGGGLLRVRISQYDAQTVRIVLDLAGAYDCSARFAANPSRLEITVMPRGLGR